MADGRVLNAERQRLENQRVGKENWRRWGPYLSERAWGTVREDYSAYGDAWDFLPHDHARSRAYRWSEDGLGGISDENQFLCLALALWNGRDPFLKERAFGLTGTQGNRGEDVKEYYFYLDATPSHSYMRYLYKYPQTAYPYERLVEENAHRDRNSPSFNLLDTGVFDGSRYFDVEVVYSKAGPEEIHLRIVAHNRGPEAAELHLLPTVWFRNTWTWRDGVAKPTLRAPSAPAGAAWLTEADHPQLGNYFFYGRQPAELLFTENESNGERMRGQHEIKANLLTGRYRERVLGGEFRAAALRIDGAAVAIDDEAMERVLHIRRGVRLTPQPLTVAFVLSEQELSRLTTIKKIFPELRMVGFRQPGRAF
jgi:hypothetical protein